MLPGQERRQIHLQRGGGGAARIILFTCCLTPVCGLYAVAAGLIGARKPGNPRALPVVTPHRQGLFLLPDCLHIATHPHRFSILTLLGGGYPVQPALPDFTRVFPAGPPDVKQGGPAFHPFGPGRAQQCLGGENIFWGVRRGRKSLSGHQRRQIHFHCGGGDGDAPGGQDFRSQFANNAHLPAVDHNASGTARDVAGVVHRLQFVL